MSAILDKLYNINSWVLLGLFGQTVFFARFLVQWIASEKKKESYIPIAFWYLSLCGSVILLTYSIHVEDPVFIVGQSTGFTIYLRNLFLIHKSKKKKKMLEASAVSS